MNAAGTIFRITPDGVFTLLYTCEALNPSGDPVHLEDATNADGAGPMALMQASDGNLYGVMWYGGPGASGTIFRLDPSSGAISTRAMPSRSSASIISIDPWFSRRVAASSAGTAQHSRRKKWASGRCWSAPR